MAKISSALECILQRKFDLISSTTLEADFYLETSNYVFFVLSDYRLKAIVDGIKQIERRDLETFNSLKEKLLTVLVNLKKLLERKIIDEKIESESISKRLQRYNKLLSGDIQTNQNLWTSLEYVLRDISRELILKKVDIKEIATLENDKLQFSKSFEELITSTDEEFENIKKLERFAIWGAWRRVHLIPVSIFTKKSE